MRAPGPTFGHDVPMAPPADGSSARILVVDDEDGVAELVGDALGIVGYRTERARHGMEALTRLRESRFDLVILDVSMPMLDGFSVLERMRASGDMTPVIVLTARQQKEDTRQGFTLGADDFVRKPFGIEELTLRVAAVLRCSQPASEDTSLRLGRIVLDVDQHQVTADGEIVELSPTEFRLLHVLMSEAGRVLTREQLLQRVWGLDGWAETTVVETYVSYLRRKFGDLLTLRTVRGVGYQLIIPTT
jgi:two-component system, OmpR family, response regulator